MSGSGRKFDQVWLHFNRQTEPGKTGSRAICKKCGKDIQGLDETTLAGL